MLRLLGVGSPLRYARSSFGIVDLLAIVPTYVSILLPGSQSFVVIRSLRLLRVFRVFKLTHFLSEAADLRRAVWQARGKIVVFLATVLIAVSIMGSAMYVVENLDGPSEQFTSIPQGMYWAVVTMTTVGYGDVVPETVLGKMLSAVLIILGYSLIIVPTGFVSAELVPAARRMAEFRRSARARSRHARSAGRSRTPAGCHGVASGRTTRSR